MNAGYCTYRAEYATGICGTLPRSGLEPREYLEPWSHREVRIETGNTVVIETLGPAIEVSWFAGVEASAQTW